MTDAEYAALCRDRKLIAAWNNRRGRGDRHEFYRATALDAGLTTPEVEMRITELLARDVILDWKPCPPGLLRAETVHGEESTRFIMYRCEETLRDVGSWNTKTNSVCVLGQLRTLAAEELVLAWVWSAMAGLLRRDADDGLAKGRTAVAARQRRSRAKKKVRVVVAGGGLFAGVV